MSGLKRWRVAVPVAVAFVAGASIATLAVACAAAQGAPVYLESVRFAYSRQEGELANTAFAAGDVRNATGHAYCASAAYGKPDAFGEQAPPWHAGILVAGLMMSESLFFGLSDPADYSALQRARFGYVLERAGDAEGAQRQYELAEAIKSYGISRWRDRAAASFGGPARE